jgi:Ca-activated chloride channel homolog
MPVESLKLDVITERPVVRNDQPSEIDVAIDVITNKAIETQSIKHAINLCIVIDRSGSMRGDKLEQAKKACVDIHESLGQNDLLTVLAFDDEVVSVANPQTPRQVVKERIMALSAGGETDLSKGWYLGLLELQTYASEKHINRIILLSDGQANQGEKKPSVLSAESSRARNEHGITTSTIGIGADFQEDMLAALAHESGGRFWFIGEARVEDIIKEEFSGALSVMFERPRVELELPPGVSIIKELNDLPKVSGNYRLRPIKGNDQFSLALRLHVEPAKTDADRLAIRATLRDGTEVVTQVETILRVGSAEDYIQSAEDARVAMVVQKYLTAVSDEKIVEQMGAGNVTKMLTMLHSQSSLLKDLEAKLAGATAISWEVLADKDLENQRQQLAALRMEIEENAALMVVGELVNLLQGLGRTQDAIALLSRGRKGRMVKGMRNQFQNARGNMDDWAAGDLLINAKSTAQRLMPDFPNIQEELASIIRRLDEQLAHFS